MKNSTTISKDYIEASRWLRLAADQGYAKAQTSLGSMYGEGEGLTKDLVEAIKWYCLAAEQGEAEAQFNLGRAYATGEGVAQDYVEAYKWYSLAAAAPPSSRSSQLEDANPADMADKAAEYMTSAQITEANRRVQEWKPKQNAGNSKNFSLLDMNMIPVELRFFHLISVFKRESDLYLTSFSRHGVCARHSSGFNNCAIR